MSKKSKNQNFQSENLKQKKIVRSWGLAKRLDPKTIKEEEKK